MRVSFVLVALLGATAAGCGQVNERSQASPDALCADGPSAVDEGGETCAPADALAGTCVPVCGVRDVGVGTGYSCAVLHDGRVKCWGYNDVGTLGLGSRAVVGDEPGEMGGGLAAVDLGMGNSATAIAAGYLHVCALLDSGAVKCWGQNHAGTLGLGDERNRGELPGQMGDALPPVDLGRGKVAVALAAAAFSTCAVLSDGTVKCWGAGPLGIPLLDDNWHRGDEPGEMGDHLPTVDLGEGRAVVSLVAGYGHYCALLSNSTVKCWGYNDHGQLGQGDTASRGAGEREMGSWLLPVRLGTGKTAMSIAAGGAHTCAVLNDGAVKCWGNNWSGQLGLVDEASRGDEAGEMGDDLPEVDLGPGKTAVAIVAGERHTCALLSDGAVTCWGYNESGVLGRGRDYSVSYGAAPGEMGEGLRRVELGAGEEVTLLRTGWEHTCARLGRGNIKCWGGNYSGELGLGDTRPRGVYRSDMGDDLPAVKLYSERW
ncbi:RCC1 domain-containing protein [Chondromyces crocatus]|nr:RCC1 domain-containing protein [Chondromyces crocatus]